MQRQLIVVILVFICNSQQHAVEVERFQNINGFKWIPQLDGTMKLVSDAEIKETLSKSKDKLFYNPLKDVKFTLYGKRDSAKVVTIHDHETLLSSQFDPNATTILLTHGWNGHGEDWSCSGPRKQYLQYDEHINVIQIDWSKGSSDWTYLISKNRVPATGHVVAEFVLFMVNTTGINVHNIHLVGFSLGAHVMGAAGKEIYRQLNAKVATIIAIEPALPLYSTKTSEVTQSSADHVEAIHTSGGNLGFYDPLGHSDFYVNGGRSQPGCGIDFWGNCAHARAVDCFIESLSKSNSFSGKNSFWSRPCLDLKGISSKGCTYLAGSCEMGGCPIAKEKGLFWLKTNKNSPFAMGPYW